MLQQRWWLDVSICGMVRLNICSMNNLYQILSLVSRSIEAHAFRKYSHTNIGRVWYVMHENGVASIWSLNVYRDFWHVKETGICISCWHYKAVPSLPNKFCSHRNRQTGGRLQSSYCDRTHIRQCQWPWDGSTYIDKRNLTRRAT